ncbi:hypothetical protein [Bdellovibrio bacteriovorus]|uniref:hypothetical protein n=1 Tax=Bdellovibrio bacteriovorus TaxID=959 RepID=UPI0035A8F8F3
MFLELIFIAHLSMAADVNKKSVAEVIPVTMANLRGHNNLYKEGWFLVTSSEKALSYAKENGIENAGSALTRLQVSLKQRNESRQENISQFKADLEAADLKAEEKGRARSENIRAQTDNIKDELNLKASENASKAWQEFIYGNISLVKRTADDRQELVGLPGKYFANLKSDYGNLQSLSRDITRKQAPQVESAWSQGFKKAAEEFDKEYQESGKRSNTLVALGDISWGYLKSIYHAVFAPAGKSTVKGIHLGEEYIVKTAVLVGGETLSIVGRTVETVGLSVFYTGKMGYKVLSPTLESGLLISLASAQKLSAPVVKGGGEGLRLLNQVAVNVVEPAGSAVGAVANAAIESAKYGGLVTYDVLATSAEVSILELKSGVVLGYNALTALPTHVVLGAANTVFFLAWDGPRLVIAKASGNLVQGDEQSNSTNLPVGTVVDLEKLKKQEGVQVEAIEASPEQVEKVLKELPRDL